MERETGDAIAQRGRSDSPSVAARRSHLAVAVLRTLRDPVVGILLLAALFDGLSDNAIHALLLAAVAVALMRDAVIRSPGAAREEAMDRSTGARLGQSGLVVAALTVLAAAFAILAGGLARYSWPVTVAVLVPATVGLLLSWRPPADGAPAPGRLDLAGTVLWVGVFVALALWELTSLLLQPSLTTDSYAHPTLSVLSDPILASHVGRTIGLFLWLAFGWFLIHRIPEAER